MLQELHRFSAALSLLNHGLARLNPFADGFLKVLPILKAYPDLVFEVLLLTKAMAWTQEEITACKVVLVRCLTFIFWL